MAFAPAGLPCPRMSRLVYIETFGCQMNLADTETVLARLAEHDYRACASADAADLILYNTCSVRDNAEAKVRGRLDHFKRIKLSRPNLRIGVMGCMAQRLKEELLTRYPQVDLVVGTDQFVHIPALLDQIEAGQRLAATDFGDFEDRNWHAQRSAGINAWVPVMRGCNYNCTYCIVPTTRGREKSRRPELIEEEVREVVDQGFCQVTLLGQTIDAYGKTLGDGSTLAGLLRRLHRIDGLQRLRFVTSHPKDITDDLLDTIGDLPKVAKHLHVPAQCGSDRILRLMGRRYTRAEYLRFVERARTRIPGVELLSDFIVGFPRETDEDFQATVDLMEEVRFDGAYVFMYSPRPDTGANRLTDDVAQEAKKARCNSLLALQLAQQEARHQQLIGSELEILVEGPSRTNEQRLMGRSLGNRMVIIPRPGNDHLIGNLVRVRINEATNLSLFGTPT